MALLRLTSHEGVVITVLCVASPTLSNLSQPDDILSQYSYFCVCVSTFKSQGREKEEKSSVAGESIKQEAPYQRAADAKHWRTVIKQSSSPSIVFDIAAVCLAHAYVTPPFLRFSLYKILFA